jgi:hypothetical protein
LLDLWVHQVDKDGNVVKSWNILQGGKPSIPTWNPVLDYSAGNIRIDVRYRNDGPDSVFKFDSQTVGVGSGSLGQRISTSSDFVAQGQEHVQSVWIPMWSEDIDELNWIVDVNANLEYSINTIRITLPALPPPSGGQVKIYGVTWNYERGKTQAPKIVLSIDGGYGWDNCAEPSLSNLLIPIQDGVLDNLWLPPTVIDTCFGSLASMTWLKEVIKWCRDHGYKEVHVAGFSAGANTWMFYLTTLHSSPSSGLLPVDTASFAGIMDVGLSSDLKDKWKQITTPVYVAKGGDVVTLSGQIIKDISDQFYDAVASTNKRFHDFDGLPHSFLGVTAAPEIAQWVKDFVPIGPTPTIIVSPTTVKQGESISVSGAGCTPNAAVEFHFKGSAAEFIASWQTDSAGTFSQSFPIGTNVEPGVWTAYIIDQAGKSNEVSVTVETLAPSITITDMWVHELDKDGEPVNSWNILRGDTPTIGCWDPNTCFNAGNMRIDVRFRNDGPQSTFKFDTQTHGLTTNQLGDRISTPEATVNTGEEFLHMHWIRMWSEPIEEFNWIVDTGLNLEYPIQTFKVNAICEEGSIEVLEYCPDGTTWKRRRICMGNKWVEESQDCPGPKTQEMWFYSLPAEYLGQRPSLYKDKDLGKTIMVNGVPHQTPFSLNLEIGKVVELHGDGAKAWDYWNVKRITGEDASYTVTLWYTEIAAFYEGVGPTKGIEVLDMWVHELDNMGNPVKSWNILQGQRPTIPTWDPDTCFNAGNMRIDVRFKNLGPAANFKLDTQTVGLQTGMKGDRMSTPSLRVETGQDLLHMHWIRMWAEPIVEYNWIVNADTGEEYTVPSFYVYLPGMLEPWKLALALVGTG